jgi:glycosyltransferase involved in cell wall biosynthesis
VDPVASTGAERGEVVVCLELAGAREDVERSLRTLLAQTPEDVEIVAFGGPSGSEAGNLIPAGGRIRHLPGGVAAAIDASAPADVAWLRAGCQVAAGWLDGLRDAAYTDSRVASASPLSDRAIALPELGSSIDFEDAAAAVRNRSPRLRPRGAGIGGDCVYVRRSAIELLGGAVNLDTFSREAVKRGLCHVVADDVLVSSAGTSAPPPPWASSSRPLADALAAARRALHGLTIAIDARILTGPMNGSKRHALELIAALARVGEHRLTAFVTAGIDRETLTMLEAVPGLKLVDVSSPAVDRADVVHRPFQVESPADLRFLARVGERTIVTQQDLIGYYNPAYFPSLDDWQRYRGLTRRALALADHVVFFSEHVRAEALAERLVDAHRASVVHIGVDHRLPRSISGSAIPPHGVGEQLELILCIGTDYEHKNRRFALRLVRELKDRHGWRGRLVLAGSHVAWGGSASSERRLLDDDPWLREAVIDLGFVSQAEKLWLLGRARLVIYPSVSEGFGLVPFEAAEHGVPSLWARGTSLSEILPDAAAALVPWDAAASADRVAQLLRDESVRRANVAAVRKAGEGLRWDTAAARLIEIYRDTCDAPPVPGGAIERSEGLMQEGFSEDAVRLVGPGGALPRELERPLLALAMHPRLRAPVFGALRAGYRASSRLRRRAGDKR